MYFQNVMNIEAYFDQYKKSKKELEYNNLTPLKIYFK